MTRPVKTMVVAGARPNFVKVAPVLHALARRGLPASFVHTGQHYDSAMSGSFLDDLNIPAPDHHLGVGSGSHAQQTARVMESFEPVLVAEAPSWLIVVGDVNSTLACSLVASKLGLELGTRIAHVEAGLRSGDWSMPEEVNRVLTDRISDLLLIPSEDARSNLLREGISNDRIQFVGNVMVDTLFEHLTQARALDRPRFIGVAPNAFALVTLHRPSNVDGAESFVAIIAGLERIADRMPVVMPLHPRTRQRAESFGLMDRLSRFQVLPPQSYLEMLSLTSAAAVVLTDSGGLQEETTVLGVPCITLRDGTERPITILEGTNRLCAWPVTAAGIESSFHDAIAHRGRRESTAGPLGWDGRAAERVVDALENAEGSIGRPSDGAQKPVMAIR